MEVTPFPLRNHVPALPIDLSKSNEKALGFGNLTNQLNHMCQGRSTSYIGNSHPNFLKGNPFK